mmetsp:Transcript_3903/g.12179  ORF Transcript_3903/g.12179 Transcript_3903/m.12179 type:complete len:230 (-) Transcript_3903:2825-3514(-)
MVCETHARDMEASCMGTVNGVVLSEGRVGSRHLCCAIDTLSLSAVRLSRCASWSSGLSEESTEPSSRWVDAADAADSPVERPPPDRPPPERMPSEPAREGSGPAAPREPCSARPIAASACIVGWFCACCSRLSRGPSGAACAAQSTPAKKGCAITVGAPVSRPRGFGLSMRPTMSAASAEMAQRDGGQAKESDRIARYISATFEPWKGVKPVSSSYVIAPKDHQSAAAS